MHYGIRLYFAGDKKTIQSPNPRKEIGSLQKSYFVINDKPTLAYFIGCIQTICPQGFEPSQVEQMASMDTAIKYQKWNTLIVMSGYLGNELNAPFLDEMTQRLPFNNTIISLHTVILTIFENE